MTIAVYYEENYHELSYDCGPVSGIKLFENVEDVYNHAVNSILVGIQEGFVIDNTDSRIMEDGSFNYEQLKTDLLTNNIICVTMFAGCQDNWETAYDIVVELKEVN